MSGLMFVTMVKAQTFLPRAIRIAVVRHPSLPAVSMRMGADRHVARRCRPVRSRPPAAAPADVRRLLLLL
jgi:hypothetical protein